LTRRGVFLQVPYEDTPKGVAGLQSAIPFRPILVIAFHNCLFVTLAEKTKRHRVPAAAPGLSVHFQPTGESGSTSMNFQ
jgi:hypothetical protein